MGYASAVDDAAGAVASALAGRAAGVRVETTGSTGAPREALLATAALRASAEATADRLGGHGAWLLAVPDHKVAGVMVLVRSALAGVEPVRMGPGPFTAAGFAAAVEALADRSAPGERLYASLVPTQVTRVLADPAGRAAFARLTAVLVGGAAPPASLPTNAVVTYGMSETCGGCVYEGVPLDGVEVAIAGDGRIHLAGPVLADGYADADDRAFVRMAGRRWLRTSDLGEERDGRLAILGRADDVIVTGGMNVHPALVEAAVASVPGVAACAVVGVPDAEWGEAVVAVIEATPGVPAPSAPQLREALGGQIPRHALPRRTVVVDSVPTLAPGKIDRRAARQIAVRRAREGA